MGDSSSIQKKLFPDSDYQVKKKLKDKFVSSDGYVYVRCLGHVRARVWGKRGRREWVAEHVLVAEKMLGRYLVGGEIVHHINRNRSDNRPENLQVLSSASEHQALHQRERTPEQHREFGRRAYAAGLVKMTHEQHRESGRRAYAAGLGKMTHEQRKEIARRREAGMRPGQKSEVIARQWSKISSEKRSEIMRRRAATKTSEQRSEIARRGWATRRSKRVPG